MLSGLSFFSGWMVLGLTESMLIDSRLVGLEEELVEVYEVKAAGTGRGDVFVAKR